MTVYFYVKKGYTEATFESITNIGLCPGHSTSFIKEEIHMNKMWKRLLACTLAGVMAVGMLAGCGKTTTESTKTSESTAQKESTAASESKVEAEKPAYPIEGDVTLTLAMVQQPEVVANAKDLSETPFGEAWQEATGINLEMIQLADAQALNLLIASGDLPDMIWWNVETGYKGGAVGAIKDKIVQPINDYIDYCPEFMEILKSNEAYEKAITVSGGNIYGFPCMYADSTQVTSAGIIMRDDWLEDLGLERPQTPDEFYNALKAFKEEKGATVPLCTYTWYLVEIGLEHGLFSSAFGLPRCGFYQEDDVVHYGYAEIAYKDVLAYLNKLYEDGLLDPNFQTVDQATVDANIMNGTSGCVINTVGGGMGGYLSTVLPTDPSYDLCAIQPLVANRGDIPMSTHYSSLTTGSCVTITPACENVEAAVRFLNYGYTEEGSTLFNWGIEGESYEVVDGQEVWTDYVLNNPDGLDANMVKAMYCRSWSDGPYRKVKNPNRFQTEQQMEALEVWTASTAEKYHIPAVSVSEDDSAEYARLGNDILTYINEMTLKYILGTANLGNFESEYLATLDKLGIKEYIAIEQRALDEYVGR